MKIKTNFMLTLLFCFLFTSLFLNVTNADTVQTKLSGQVIGTPGSFGNGSDTIAKVFDGDINTFFDGPQSTNGDGCWAGLDLGKPYLITEIRFVPRPNYPERMIGGTFQGSITPDFASPVNLATIWTAPTPGVWTEIVPTYVATPFRYVRYLSPDSGWGDVSEIEFYTGARIAGTAIKKRHHFIEDQMWLDNNGVPINAHGGGVMFYDGTYYWFGESYPFPNLSSLQQTGVRCYSSKDLYNWTDEGIALARVDNPSSDITKGCIIERPKVIYNAKTKKFVMWFHLELKGEGYSSQLSGVAVAVRPEGPYTYLHSVKPDAGAGARDMTLFVDDDGTGYHVFASEDNHKLHISQLSDDYLSHIGRWSRVSVNGDDEAPAIFKYQGRYFMIASGLSGWDPNEARSAVADSIAGPWTSLGNPLIDDTPIGVTTKISLDEWKQLGKPSTGGVPRKYTLGPELTFGAQSTCVFPVQGHPGEFIAMFDVWRPENQITSGYIWLPVVFENDKFTIPWRDEWSY